MFNEAGIPCRISESIEADLWTKMVMNCAHNAISALTRTRYDCIVQFEPLRLVMQRAISESVAVARADGIALSEPALTEAGMQLGQAMSGALSSTAQDIGRGKVTEIDSLNCYVAHRGSLLGIPTPVNDALYALVKALEQSGASGSGVQEALA